MQGHPVNVKHDARYDMAKAGRGRPKKTNRRILIYYCCQWRSQGGGTLVHVPPVVIRVKFLRAWICYYWLWKTVMHSVYVSQGRSQDFQRVGAPLPSPPLPFPFPPLPPLPSPYHPSFPPFPSHPLPPFPSPIKRGVRGSSPGKFWNSRLL